MESINRKILGEINILSRMSLVSPLEVNKTFKLDEIEFGDRLLYLKRLRYIRVEKNSCAPEKSLPNGICAISITDDGRQFLRRLKYI
ncbi:MAG: hypothetical protein LUQ38_08765 [Methanotrichaceae archaeon]|nr:hypothetical protein [Methanotrichaceae archaeon]